jgi:DNA-binding NarL/FixJ family response regulator
MSVVRFRRLGIRLERQEPARGLASLSERERGVLALLVKGLTNREIAEELGIATGTVKKHVSHMLSKRRLKTRTSLATRE